MAPPARPAILGAVFAAVAVLGGRAWPQAGRNFAAAHDGAAGYDFDPMLAELRPLLEPADLAVCHRETPVAPEGGEYTTASSTSCSTSDGSTDWVRPMPATGPRLFLMLQTYGSWVISGVTREKSSRVVEDLLASVHPGDCSSERSWASARSPWSMPPRSSSPPS